MELRAAVTAIRVKGHHATIAKNLPYYKNMMLSDRDHAGGRLRGREAEPGCRKPQIPPAMPEHLNARPTAAEGRCGASWGVAELGRTCKLSLQVHIRRTMIMAMMTAVITVMNGQPMSSHVVMPGVVPMAGLCCSGE